MHLRATLAMLTQTAPLSATVRERSNQTVALFKDGIEVRRWELPSGASKTLERPPSPIRGTLRHASLDILLAPGARAVRDAATAAALCTGHPPWIAEFAGKSAMSRLIDGRPPSSLVAPAEALLIGHITAELLGRGLPEELVQRGADKSTELYLAGFSSGGAYAGGVAYACALHDGRGDAADSAAVAAANMVDDAADADPEVAEMISRGRISPELLEKALSADEAAGMAAAMAAAVDGPEGLGGSHSGRARERGVDAGVKIFRAPTQVLIDRTIAETLRKCNLPTPCREGCASDKAAELLAMGFSPGAAIAAGIAYAEGLNNGLSKDGAGKAAFDAAKALDDAAARDENVATMLARGEMPHEALRLALQAGRVAGAKEAADEAETLKLRIRDLELKAMAGKMTEEEREELKASQARLAKLEESIRRASQAKLEGSFQVSKQATRERKGAPVYHPAHLPSAGGAGLGSLHTLASSGVKILSGKELQQAEAEVKALELRIAELERKAAAGKLTEDELKELIAARATLAKIKESIQISKQGMQKSEGQIQAAAWGTENKAREAREKRAKATAEEQARQRDRRVKEVAEREAERAQREKAEKAEQAQRKKAEKAEQALREKAEKAERALREKAEKAERAQREKAEQARRAMTLNSYDVRLLGERNEELRKWRLEGADEAQLFASLEAALKPSGLGLVYDSKRESTLSVDALNDVLPMSATNAARERVIQEHVIQERLRHDEILYGEDKGACVVM